LVWILLTGSMASTCTTICFFYVLARFPPFIQQVKEEGAEPSVIVRLITFYQLNVSLFASPTSAKTNVSPSKSVWCLDLYTPYPFSLLPPTALKLLTLLWVTCSH